MLRAVLDEILELQIPSEQIAELRRAVTTKPSIRTRVSSEEIERFIALLAELGNVLEPLGHEPPRVVRDPHDDYLIESAKCNGIETLISGDRDLHALHDQLPWLAIMSPADLSRILHGERNQDS